MRGAVVVLLAVLVAGCTTQAPPEPTPEVAPVDEPSVALSLAPPARVVRAPLDISLDLSEEWLKPLRPLDVAAHAPAAAALAWFVELDGEPDTPIEARVSVVDGDIFVLKSTTPDHHNTEGPRTPVALATLMADGRARGMHLATSGRHTFEGDGARLVVNAWPAAPEAAAQAFLVEEEGKLRFEPPEIDVRPGTRVLLWSQATRPLELRETAFAAFVPFEAREGRMTPVDEGLFRVVAVAVSASARGVAEEPFLVDFERPSDRLTVGPFMGELVAPEAALDEPRQIAFRAVHALESLTLAFEARSNAPLPASIVVALHQEDELLAEASSLSAATLELADLPAGEYTIEVRGEHGALVAYEVSGEGRYRLPTPARLREMTT